MKRALVAAAAVALVIRIIPMAFANLVAVRSLAGRPSPALLAHASVWAPAAPFVAMNELLDGQSAVLPQSNRTMEVDQLLILAAARLQSDCAAGDRALTFAQQSGHDSAFGYVRLGDAYLHNAGRCDHGYLKTVASYEAAGRAGRAETQQKCRRAEGWFDAAQLKSNSDVDAALRDYDAAIAVEPADNDCGYPWMAAMAKAGFQRQRGDIAGSRQTYTMAMSMGVSPQRRAEALEHRERLGRQ